MHEATRFRSWFVVAAALAAASFSDPLVEKISSTGIFGRGFDDTDQAGALPALLLGMACLFGLVVTLAVRSLRTSSNDGRTVAALALEGSIGGLVLRTVPLQMAAVYGIERCEAVAAHGAFAAGFDWLGGPFPAALALHALVAVAAVVFLRALASLLVDRARAIVREAAAWLLRPALAIERAAAVVCRARRRFHYRATHALVRRVRGRAPPPILAFV